MTSRPPLTGICSYCRVRTITAELTCVKGKLSRCQSSLKMSPSLPRLKCPLFVFWFALFFFPCARSPFSSKNFALGCPRNDDSYLGRPTASPVFGRPPIVKIVVRWAELLKGYPHGFQVSGVLLIEATDNPRPVHKLCHQTQHPKQDHYLESPRTRPEPLPALSFDASQQVVQKQEEE